MKNTIFIFLLLTVSIAQSQHLFDGYTIKEYNYYYKDSVNGETAFGQYKPTDLIGLYDGAMIVSTEFSITFPSQYKTSITFDSTYLEKEKKFSEKSHISSGSIFKLNNKFEKEWETVFYDKRVKRIILRPDSSIIAVGERVDMKKFWMASLDLNGRILWEKEIKNTNNVTVTVCDAIIDSIDNIYILLSSERLIPFRINKDDGYKKVEFFKNRHMDGDLYLMKLSPFGKKKWLTTLDNRKTCWTFGWKLVFGKNNIYASSAFEGFRKNRKKWEKLEGELIYEVSPKGKIKNMIENNIKKLLFYQDGLFTITKYAEDTLILHKNNKAYDSIKILSANKDLSIKNAIPIKKGFLILGSNYDDNNRDYLIIRVNENLKLDDYWSYNKDDYNEISSAVEMPDGTLVIMGECSMRDSLNNLVSYINIVSIKK
jgi:hypothetical protein